MNTYKQLLYTLLLLLLAANLNAAPVILYSDLTSAPNQGWSSVNPDRGAVVTIWGHGFGETGRGNSFVTVNGININTDNDFAEPWGERKPNPHIQKISFHLNNAIPLGAGTISATVGGMRSNAVPFHVNNSKIYFADATSSTIGDGTIISPWKDMMSFLRIAQPGDVIYLRAGIFSEKIDGGQETFYIRNGVHGTSRSPIGMVGYPNETAVVDALTTKTDLKRTAIHIKNNWYTFSKLQVNADQMAIYANGVGIRVIGNDTIGVKTAQFGAAAIVTSKDYAKVLGNSVHGGRSANRLDHGIYITGCSPIEGTEVAYNYMYDNNVAEGPIIVVNHQKGRCSPSVYLKSHYIHSNFIDCTNYRSKAIGIYDQSWDGGDETEPEPTYVYNNISISCGIDRNWPAMYQTSAHVEWYNNVVYDSRGVGLELAGSRGISSKVKNNIFHLTRNWEYVRHINGGTAEIENNVYWGSTGNLTAPGSIDANAIFSDPGILANTLNASITVNETMFGIGVLDPGVIAVVTQDYNGNDRPGISISVGALESNSIAASLVNKPLAPSNFSVILD